MTDLSYQLYSSREFPPWGDTFKMLADIGYKSVEAYRLILNDLDGVEAALSQSGLTLKAAHMGFDSLEDDEAWVRDVVARFGLQSVYVPHLQQGDRPKTAEGWRDIGKRLEDVIGKYKDLGIDIGWHNHDFEFHPTDTGEIPMDLILEAAPSAAWEADLAWVERGGADPMAYLQRYGPRITSLHVKDIAPSGQNLDEDGWADVGHGVMDWPSLIAASKAFPIKHFIMEHDKPSDHERFAKRSYANLAAWMKG